MVSARPQFVIGEREEASDRDDVKQLRPSSEIVGTLTTGCSVHDPGFAAMRYNRFAVAR